MPVRAAGDVDRSVVASAFAGFMVAAKMNAEGDAALEKRRITNQAACSSRAGQVILCLKRLARHMH